MKLLWVVSNWKRTGPVEPSLDLAAAIASRGHEVLVMTGRSPRGIDDDAAAAARARGLEVLDIGMALGKHRSPLRDWRDVRRLRRYLAKSAPDTVVTTLRNAHRIAMRAMLRGPRVYACRLIFEESGPSLIDTYAQGIEFELVPDLNGERARAVPLEPALDIAALETRAKDAAGIRRELGVPEGGFLFGIVARMQTHRRFELLWEAVRELKHRGVVFRLAAIGRGTNQASVAHEPVREMGLEDVVVFPGYLRGEAYASTLAALDAQIFLVPGSDPTCRALREGMALGVPSLVSTRGSLPAIVRDGTTGRVVEEETLAAWADAMAEMVREPERTRAMGEAAAGLARERYEASAVAKRFIEALESQHE